MFLLGFIADFLFTVKKLLAIDLIFTFYSNFADAFIQSDLLMRRTEMLMALLQSPMVAF